MDANSRASERPKTHRSRTSRVLRENRGIDVSHQQGRVEWQSVRASGITFVIAKATEGTSFVDPKFRTNWAAIKNARLVRGAYHFFRARTGANEQAEHFLSVVGALEPGDLVPALDVEASDGTAAAVILDGVGIWLRTVAAALGRKPMIYTTPAFWRDSVGNSTRFAAYPLWIAHYTSASQPDIPGGWRRWTLWQFSKTGTVNGVQGAVDLDRSSGTIEQLLPRSILV
jgi:lysozyme